ncbi:MAG: AraC family transcriptional regulator [Clostridiales bacterium]|nr:AraC family transcriptional regulator [Clostridiales bacterium]
MNILYGMNQAIEYLEENMQGDIDFQKAAEFTGYSSAYFQRIFTCIAQITVVEYVRKRRMTLAAAELKDSNIQILDLAIKYGYHSADAFTKAFRSFHGVTPSEARNSTTRVNSFSPLRFHISVEGTTEMKYRMEQRKAMRVIGIQRHFVAPEDDEHAVDTFWNEVFRNGMYEKLLALCDGQPHGVHGFMQVVDETHVDYMIGVFSRHEVIDGTSEFIVPASMWAIFEQKGSIHDTMPILWKQIFDEWLPALEVQHAETTEIECFPYEGDRSSKEFQYEIWIPIKKGGHFYE